MTADEENVGMHSWQNSTSFKKRLTKSQNKDFFPRLLMPIPKVCQNKSLLNFLCDEVLDEMIPYLVQEVFSEVREEYLESDIISSVISDFILEILLEEDGELLVNEVLNECHEEYFLHDKILNPVVMDLLHDIVAETIETANEREFLRHSKEIAIEARQNLLDSFLIEELLSLLVQQGRLWTESEEENRILEDFMFDALLSQLHKFHEAKSFIHECVPLNRLHQRIVTDISMNVLLQQLTSSLMEDEKEIDRFEEEHKTIQPCKKIPFTD